MSSNSANRPSRTPSVEDKRRHALHLLACVEAETGGGDFKDTLNAVTPPELTPDSLTKRGHKPPYFPPGTLCWFYWELPAKKFAEALVEAGFEAGVEVVSLLPSEARSATGAARLGIRHYVVAQQRISPADSRRLTVVLAAWRKCCEAIDVFLPNRSPSTRVPSSSPPTSSVLEAEG